MPWRPLAQNWLERDDALFERQVEEAISAVSRLRHRPRVIWRGTAASIPHCWTKRDPLAAPFRFDFGAQPALLQDRGVKLFGWHRFGPQAAVARGIVERAGHAYLDTYTQTAMRPGGHHPSRHDCVHWCLPGPPDEWTRLLLLLLLHGSPRS